MGHQACKNLINLKSNYHSIYNLGSVGFCSATMNRYILKISDDRELNIALTIMLITIIFLYFLQ